MTKQSDVAQLAVRLAAMSKDGRINKTLDDLSEESGVAKSAVRTVLKSLGLTCMRKKKSMSSPYRLEWVANAVLDVIDAVEGLYEKLGESPPNLTEARNKLTAVARRERK